MSKRRHDFEMKAQGMSQPKKTEKAAKETRLMFTEMTKSSQSGAVRAVGGMVSGFGMLINLIKPFEPILKTVSALFGVLAGSVMKSLMPAMMPFIKMLIALAPLFELVGGALGWLIGTVLTGILYVIYGIAKAIAWFVDLFSWMWGAPGSAQAAVDAFFQPVLGSYATGTRAVPQTGNYKLHKDEIVQTPDQQLAEYKREYLLENINRGITKLVSMKEEDR